MPHSDRLYSLGTIENDLIYFVKFVKFPRRETLFFFFIIPPPPQLFELFIVTWYHEFRWKENRGYDCFGFLAGDGERLESMKVVRGGKRSGRGEEEIG